MKRIFKTIATVLGVLLAFLLYSLASERYYVRTKSPAGITTVSDYFRRFGEPAFVRMAQRDGRSYYEFNGRVDPAWWCLALPSGPPAYIFDERGQFIEWCAEPGDSSRYRQRWRLTSTNEVEVAGIKARFGL